MRSRGGQRSPDRNVAFPRSRSPPAEWSEHSFSEFSPPPLSPSPRRTTNWRQHSLFQFLSESAHGLSHENGQLYEHLDGAWQMVEALQGHVKLLEREIERQRTGHQSLEKTLRKERTSRKFELAKLREDIDGLLRQYDEYSSLRRLVLEDLTLLPTPSADGSDDPAVAPTDCGDGAAADGAAGAAEGESSLDDASEAPIELAFPIDLDVRSIGDELNRRRSGIAARRAAETTGLELAADEVDVVNDAIKDAMEEAIVQKRKRVAKQEVDDAFKEIGAQSQPDEHASTAGAASGAATATRPRDPLPEHVRIAVQSATRRNVKADAAPGEVLSRARLAGEEATAAHEQEQERRRRKSSVRRVDVEDAASDMDSDDEVEAALQASADAADDNISAALETAALMAAIRKEVTPLAAQQAVRASIAAGLSPAEAVTTFIGTMSVEECCAATDAATVILGDYPSAPPMVVATAAHVAATIAASGGAEPSICRSAGVRAAMAIMRGEPFESVNELAMATAEAAMKNREEAASAGGDEDGLGTVTDGLPGWTLERWIASLDLHKRISHALLKRLRDMVEPGPTEAYELPFFLKIAGAGTPDTVLGMLKETPVLHQIAHIIHAEAQKMVRKQQHEAAGPGVSRQLSRAQTMMRVTGFAALATVSKVHSRLNAEFIKKGARTLFFSKDTSLYWEGLQRLVGKPAEPKEESLESALRREHCASADSDLPFEAHNYQTVTSSHLEWCFVAETDALPRLKQQLEALDLPTDQWPAAGNMTRGDTSDDRARIPRSFDDFATERRKVDAMLLLEGEQPLSFVEFCVLRCYSGPLFVKYNNVLRGGVCHVPYFLDFIDNVCQRNRYPTTIHVLTKAIMKLAKLTGRPKYVYRAPGGALPEDFWKRCKNGAVGFLEAGCLSTSTEKEEAMHYARRGAAGLIFQLEQGFVGRGASISWLSQYPAEAEILFPPLTALEVVDKKVEGDIVIVCMKPAMQSPPNVSSGPDELFKVEEELKRAAEEAKALEDAAAEASADEARTRMKMGINMVLDDKRLATVKWKQQMADMKTKLAMAKLAECQWKLGRVQMEALNAKLENSMNEKARLEATKAVAEKEEELRRLKEEAERKREAATRAQQMESVAAGQMAYDMGEANPQLGRTLTQEAVARDAPKRAKPKRKENGDEGRGGAPSASPQRPQVSGMSFGDKEATEENVEPVAVTTAPSAKDLYASGDFRSMRKLEEVTPFLHNAVEEHKDGVALAALEAIIKITQNTKKDINDQIKASMIAPVCETMRWGKENLALITIASCALACLTKSKSPHPRTIQEAAKKAAGVQACCNAMKVLGPTFDTPVREALMNMCKNDPGLTKQAIKNGATFLAEQGSMKK